MKSYSWSLGGSVAVECVVTREAPTNPTFANYRFDVQYNEQVNDPDFCAIEFYDKDKNAWSPLSGTLADVSIYNQAKAEPEFKGAKYLYYTFTPDEALVEPNSLIDVTPTKPGDKNVLRIT